MNSIEPRPNSREHRRERDELVGLRVVARHAAAVVRHVQFELARREADGAVAEGVAHELLHLDDLVVGRGAFGRVVAHDEPAHRAVPDVRADVHPEPAVETGEEVGERAAAERDARGERVGRHALRRG